MSAQHEVPSNGGENVLDLNNLDFQVIYLPLHGGEMF